MSYQLLMNWAIHQDMARIEKVRKSTAKTVLMAMAARAAPHYHGAISMLCRDTCLERKAVIDAIRELIDKRYLLDSGHRVGRTRSIPVYHFLADIEQSRKRNGSDIGTASVDNSPEAVPFSDGSSPVSVRKQSRFRDTEIVRKQERNKEDVVSRQKSGKPRSKPQHLSEILGNMKIAAKGGTA